MRYLFLRALPLCGCLGAILAGPVTAAHGVFKPGSLGFPATALTETRSLAARLVNDANFPINVNPAAITLTGSGAGEFSQTNDCPPVLAPGRYCRFVVTFKPQSLAGSAAILTVPSISPGHPAALLSLGGNPFPRVQNDTGVRTCSDAKAAKLACPVAGFPGQDAESGRDAHPKTNSDANGKAGFNFTKLDANGQPLPASAAEWQCVRDNVTGLVWEGKPVGDGRFGSQGLHDADDVYTWYSTDATNNNGAKGSPGKRRAFCYGFNYVDPAAWCNTEAYVNRANTEGWCGFKDWRLPDRRELVGLMDPSGVYLTGAIDRGYFPEGRSFGYWTATPHASYSAWAWSVNFLDGSSYFKERTAYLAVRLVRGDR
jgi:hypothetical protein